MNTHKWTKEEENALVCCMIAHKSMSHTEKILNINRDTIKDHIKSDEKLSEKAKECGFPRKRERRWTDKEIDFIAKNIHLSTSELAIKLNRSVSAVKKAIRVNYIRIREEALSMTNDLELQIKEIEKQIMDGDLSEKTIQEKNRLACALEERKKTCELIKNGLIRTFAILK